MTNVILLSRISVHFRTYKLQHPETFIRIHMVILAACNVSHINASGVTKMPHVVTYVYDVVW